MEYLTQITAPRVPTVDEVIRGFLAEYKSTEAKSPSKLPGLERLKRLEVARVRRSSRWLMGLVRDVTRGMPFLNDLHPFYRELVSLLIDVNQYRHSLGKVAGVERAVASIAREAISMIKASQDRASVVRARRMYIARILDVLNDVAPELSVIRDASFKLRKIPSINPNKPTIVIAGMPNTGKSSLTACISTKKPEVAEYPFTTKQIIIGHVKVYGTYAVQVVDTPGLLDRPLSERNRIELQAILALRYLADSIIFMLDPTPHSGYSLDSQLRLLREVLENFKTYLVVAINKIDIASSDEVNRAVEALRQLNVPYRPVSALECRGTRDIVDELVNGPLSGKLRDYLKAIHEESIKAGA